MNFNTNHSIKEIKMNWIIIIMLVMGLSLAIGCLVASMLMGELMMASIFGVLITMLCIEMYSEQRR
tara:strand:+ start:1265 stop:1462 length:198 start_codon:yes stop_codon:yes gene_type:complete